MKFAKTTLAAFLLVISASVMADPIIVGGPFDGMNAGEEDEILDSTTRNRVGGVRGPGLNEYGECGNGSSIEAEECWASNWLEFDVEFNDQIEEVMWYETEMDGYIALYIGGAGEFIVIKDGNDWVLIQNNSDRNFAYLSVADLAANGIELGDDRTFSHVTGYFTGVPEPGTLGLLGLGLVAIGLRRRRSEHSA